MELITTMHVKYLKHLHSNGHSGGWQLGETILKSFQNEY